MKKPKLWDEDRALMNLAKKQWTGEKEKKALKTIHELLDTKYQIYKKIVELDHVLTTEKGKDW